MRSVRFAVVACLFAAIPVVAQVSVGGGIAEELGPQVTRSILELPDVPRERTRALLPPVAQNHALQWIDGAYATQSGINCLSDPPSTGYVYTQAGYQGDPDFLWPRVGDLYWVHVVMAISMNGCAGGVDEWVEMQLPPNTNLYVTQATPIRCFYLSSAQGATWQEMTGTSVCPSQPYQGTFLPVGLGQRIVPNYGQFMINVPVYSTRPITGNLPPSPGYVTGWVSSGIASPNVYPTQWVSVVDNPPSFDTFSISSLTGTTVRTEGILRNHFRAGSLYFDLGTTTGYGTTAGPDAIFNTTDGVSAWQDWSGLTPGTTYHWRMRFIPSDGSATATSADQVFTTPGTPPPASSTPGDMQGDGKADILWRHNSAGSNIGWLMNGGAVAVSAMLPAVGDPNFKVAGLGDFQGDGKTDILWRNDTTGTSVIWLMSGLGVAASGVLPNVPAPWIIAGVGDLQGDGKADILWRNPSTGSNSVWFINGMTVAASASLPAVSDTNFKIAAVGDFQNDGKSDLLWRNSASGANVVWLMSGATVAASAVLPTVPDPNWNPVGSGDFQLDGNDDVLWRNSSTGANSIWFMSGLSMALTAALPPVGDTTWKVARVGDFQGDGKADIMWRNSVSGANAQWIMNGPNIAVSSTLPTVSDAGFQVVPLQ